MCSCSCAVIAALPFLLRAGDVWPAGMRPDVLRLLGRGPLAQLPPAQWPEGIDQPIDETLTTALERAIWRARRRAGAAAEWALQMWARAERACGTIHEDYVRGAYAWAAAEAKAAAAWLGALESGAAPERVPISPGTAWAARYSTQGSRLEHAAVRTLLRLRGSAEDTDQVLDAHKLLRAYLASVRKDFEIGTLVARLALCARLQQLLPETPGTQVALCASLQRAAVALAAEAAAAAEVAKALQSGSGGAGSGGAGNTNACTWTEQALAQLEAAVAKFGSWAKIAEHVEGKTPKQCHRRWTQYSSTRCTDEWTTDEEALLESCLAQDLRWAKMEKDHFVRVAG